jgi:Mn2+/Fe2+ NRAMP family transporter
MNLLIPSLAVVLVTTALAFFVATSLAPLILLVTSSLVLLYAYSLHRAQFDGEYKNSTWQNNLRPMAALVLIGVVIALGAGYMFMTAPGGATMGGRRR